VPWAPWFSAPGDNEIAPGGMVDDMCTLLPASGRDNGQATPVPATTTRCVTSDDDDTLRAANGVGGCVGHNSTRHGWAGRNSTGGTGMRLNGRIRACSTKPQRERFRRQLVAICSAAVGAAAASPGSSSATLISVS